MRTPHLIRTNPIKLTSSQHLLSINKSAMEHSYHPPGFHFTSNIHVRTVADYLYRTRARPVVAGDLGM